MPINQPGIDATNVVERNNYVCQIKREWHAEWRTVHDLRPLRWINSVSPVMPQAWLHYDYGRIYRREKPAGNVASAGIESLAKIPDRNRPSHSFMGDELPGHYVRIMRELPATHPGKPGKLKQDWIGVITNDTESRYAFKLPPDVSEGQSQGQQTIMAYGLEYLLDRNGIYGAYVVNRETDAAGYITPIDPDSNERVRYIDWAPDFNATVGRGDSVQGNKCAPYLRGAVFDVAGLVTTNFRSRLSAFADDNGPTVNDPNYGGSVFTNLAAKRWSDSEIATYLLFFHQPFGNHQWRLVGAPIANPPRLQFVTLNAVEILYGRNRIMRQHGRTVYGLLNELANEELGLAWNVVLPDAEDPTTPAEVRFYTRFAAPLTFGNTTVPANPERIDLAIANERRVTSANIQRTNPRKPDQINIRGDRALICATLSLADGTLIQNWTDEELAAYLAAASGAAGYGALDEDGKRQANDRVRRGDALRRVFSHFRLARNFARPPSYWRVGDGEGGPRESDTDDARRFNVQIYTGWQGGVRFAIPNVGDSASSSSFYDWDHRRPFARRVPIIAGVDYSLESVWESSGQPVTIPGAIPPPGLEAEQVAPMAFVKFANGKWAPAEIGGKSSGGANISVAANAPIIRVAFPHKHALARNHWDGAAPTDYNPNSSAVDGFDYDDLVATVAWRADHRLTVTVQVTPSASFPQSPVEMDIEVPSAQLWWIAPNTVFGVDADGALQRTPPPLWNVDGSVANEPENQLSLAHYGKPWCQGVVRNDYHILTAVGAIAKQWFGLDRYDLVIQVAGGGVIDGVEPGQLIETIDSGQSAGDVTVRSLCTQVVTENSDEVPSTTLYGGGSNVNPLQIAARGV